MTLDLSTVTAADFDALTGEGWTLYGPDGSVALSLDEVARAGASGRPGGAFALTFLAEPGQSAPQSIYAVEHARAGRLEIFLAPKTPRADRPVYEAVFA